MCRHVVVLRAWCVVVLAIPASAAVAQSPTEIVASEVSGEPATLGQQMPMPPAGQMSIPREASGTAWLPDNSPMYALHRQRGPWQIMFHENAFLQSLHESGARGAGQTGSINWIMGMAQRNVGPGRTSFRAMVSGEPWTIGGCGYPDVLASGEVCKGEQIHDLQHPHDLFMELAATYDAPLRGQTRWQLYGGPAGEPALGPVAYPHRLSAMPNPIAPISHHWFDSTHVSFGVVTAGVYGDRWKAEGSAFNGREPDEHRATMDFGALDSYAGRVWFLPTPQWALQVSAGRLNEAETGHDGGPRVDVARITATATYHRMRETGSIWASTFGWGQNRERGGSRTDALLAETTLTRHDQDTWSARFELSGKSAHDLAVEESAEVFTVAKLQGGYTRYFAPMRGLNPGIGGSLSLGFVPSSLAPQYGGRVNPGFGVYLTLRPRAHAM